MICSVLSFRPRTYPMVVSSHTGNTNEIESSPAGDVHFTHLWVKGRSPQQDCTQNKRPVKPASRNTKQEAGETSIDLDLDWQCILDLESSFSNKIHFLKREFRFNLLILDCIPIFQVTRNYISDTRSSLDSRSIIYHG